ncbi:n-acetyltransferase domain-containing protein, partial [Nephila pilipes]
EVLGTCAAVILHSKLAFVGLYAVKKSHRGKGLGVRIWKKAMEHIGERNAGLNSVPEHLRTYRDLAGFSIVAPWCTLICEGVPDFGIHNGEPEGIQ